MAATIKGHLPVLKILLAKGANVFHKAQVSHTRSGTHNLIQHSTHDTNHVHRVQSLPFTLLPMVDPLSVSSTCCLSSETGSLRWMRMVGHAFTGQLEVVAFQWWGTSWTSVDLTSAWEIMWVVEWYTTLCTFTLMHGCFVTWCRSLKHDSITHLHYHTHAHMQ